MQGMSFVTAIFSRCVLVSWASVTFWIVGAASQRAREAWFVTVRISPHRDYWSTGTTDQETVDKRQKKLPVIGQSFRVKVPTWSALGGIEITGGKNMQPWKYVMCVCVCPVQCTGANRPIQFSLIGIKKCSNISTHSTRYYTAGHPIIVAIPIAIHNTPKYFVPLFDELPKWNQSLTNLCWQICILYHEIYSITFENLKYIRKPCFNQNFCACWCLIWSKRLHAIYDVNLLFNHTE